MTQPFKGKIALDIRDSTHDWDAFLPDNAPKVRRTSSSSSTTTLDIEHHMAAAVARD